MGTSVGRLSCFPLFVKLHNFLVFFRLVVSSIRCYLVFFICTGIDSSDGFWFFSHRFLRYFFTLDGKCNRGRMLIDDSFWDCDRTTARTPKNAAKQQQLKMASQRARSAMNRLESLVQRVHEPTDASILLIAEIFKLLVEVYRECRYLTHRISHLSLSLSIQC